MIHYAGIPAWVAYPLLFIGAIAIGVFPGIAAAVVARLCATWGARALFLAPAIWVSLEGTRLSVTGQLWNAIGYSQAYIPDLIQGARIGGVYAVGFLILLVNAALAYALTLRRRRSIVISSMVTMAVAVLLVAFNSTSPPQPHEAPRTVVVAVQPNVVPDFERSGAETARLADEHFDASARALENLDVDLPRVVIWPESPMNFSFARAAHFRERAISFARQHRASLLFNSFEPAPNDGGYNAAVLVSAEGRLAGQYDKIRLMPFGEYVPLPRWFPGSGMIHGVVGEFTPGTRYTLMPLGPEHSDVPRAGVFICLESAYPEITRRFAQEGADVLVEITNDAYQGDTAVLRQHMANAIFRAVETGRSTIRVTNTGITARISPRGEVQDALEKNRAATRTWMIARHRGGQTFYLRNGDVFLYVCFLACLLSLGLSFIRKPATSRAAA
jgi:apolipoprotein N-acyltransferase